MVSVTHNLVLACSRNHLNAAMVIQGISGSSSKAPAFSLEVLIKKNYSLGFSVWYIPTAHYTSIAFINRFYLVSLFYFQSVSRATTLCMHMFCDCI